MKVIMRFLRVAGAIYLAIIGLAILIIGIADAYRALT